MFYWKVHGRHVVLTDAEESRLLERAGLSAPEQIAFRIANGRGDVLGRRVGAWLEGYARNEPRLFELDYVERRGNGPEHVAELRALVEAYKLTTGRAVWGWRDEVAMADNIGAALWLGKRPDAIFLALTRPRRRWLRHCYELIGLLGFAAAEIEHFAGNERGFVLITSGMSLSFGPDLVRFISLPDAGDEDSLWVPPPTSSHS